MCLRCEIVKALDFHGVSVFVPITLDDGSKAVASRHFDGVDIEQVRDKEVMEAVAVLCAIRTGDMLADMGYYVNGSVG